MTSSGTSRLRALAAALALVLAPAPALAHAHLVNARPAAGARLAAVPRQIVLTFSEAPTLAVSVLRLLGPDSTPVSLGALTHDAGARTITAGITGALAAGRYTVLWQTAGDDGHVQHGSYRFVIADDAEGLATAAMPPPDSARRDTTTRAAGPSTAAAASTPAAGGSSTLRGFDADSPVYVAIRWIQFAALLLLIGAVAFRWWVLPRTGAVLAEPARRDLAAGAASAALWGAWFLALSALARLAAQLATTRMASSMLLPAPSLRAELLGTVWGHGWLLEVVALIVVIAGLRVARREPTTVLAWRAVAMAVIALAFVPALSGHAVGDSALAPLTVLLDAAHVLAAGSWLGGLAIMLVAGLRVTLRAASGGRRDAPVTMVNAFTPLALGSAAVLVLSGVVAAWLHVGSLAAFTGTAYGRTLLVKLAVVALMLLAGAFNWRVTRPRIAADPGAGATQLQRVAGLEFALGLVVLAITAILVALPTPLHGPF